MSKSNRKHRLIAEAVYAYKWARKGEGDWRDILADSLRGMGWYVSHPGSDKWVAIKGPVVAKWIGNCEWSRNAIKDMMAIRRALNKAGLRRCLPRLYVAIGDVFLVEQRCEVNRGFDKTTVTYDDYKVVAAQLGPITIVDLCEKNMGLVNNRPKVIDGRLGREHEWNY